MNSPLDAERSSLPLQATEGPATLRSYWQVIWRRKWMVVVCLLVVMMATAWTTLRMRPVYEATTLLEIQKTGGGGLSLEDMFTDQALTAGVTEAVNTEMEVLKSRQVAADAVLANKLQLVLDRSEPMYRRLLGRLTGSFKASRPKTEEGNPVSSTGNTEPLRLEALQIPHIRYPVQYNVLFTGALTFSVLNSENQKVAECRMGETCATPLFSFRLDGGGPSRGTSFPLILRPLDHVIWALQSNLEVNPIRNSRLIRLRVTSGDPEEAERLLSSVVSAYMRRKVEQKTKVASQALQFIEERMKALNDSMLQAVDDLKRFKEEHQLIDLSESVKVAIDQLVDLDKSQQEIDTLRQQARFILSALESQKALDHNSLFALGNALNQPLVISLADELSRLQAERAALRSQYTERHPNVIALDQKILKLKDKIRGEIESLISSLDNREKALGREARIAEKRLKGLPETEQRLAELTRKAKVYEDTFAFLLQKRGEIQVTRASALGDAWIVDPPYADPRYIKPRIRKNVMLAAVVGLMLGIGLVFFLEYLDDSIKNAGDVQAVVPIPILGNVGHFELGNGRRPLSLPFLQLLEDPRSRDSEAFHTLCSNILFSSIDRPSRSLLLTSPTPGEGKSTCVANLGVALSQLGKRALLVDADLRKPVLHHVFKLRRSPGLANVLVEENWEGALGEAIQATQVPFLDLLTSGESPPVPNKMLGSEKMAHLIESLTQRYDFVLFDSPPLLSVSDAMVMAHRLDGVLMVVRGGRTGRSALRNAIEQMAKAHTGLLGVVLNDIDFRRERYYYYYSYGYRYAYYYAEDDSKSSKTKHLSRRPARKALPGRGSGSTRARQKVSGFLSSLKNRNQPTQRR